VEPAATFDSLVLRDDQLDELQGIVQRVRTAHVVRGEWGMGGGGAGRGSGVTCLFAGPSGVGKTLSAEVLANELGVDLYTIDLSQVVDKYIGETEKNLERIFTEAEGVNGVLFFDEADALFGKRSDVQSAHDRHANVEVAYLLQRMERFDGVAVLATNLRGNLDEAFTRRIDVILQFTEPDEGERLRLWQLHLPPSLPTTDDLDLQLLAKSLDITGGVIRNITLAAAYMAAGEGRPVAMADLVTATRREYRKVGRLVPTGTFDDLLEAEEPD
jgi:SpoVK/Ycf46/Vps4 family AAA+-type ATPase